jgi:hypothetical protein
VIVMRAVLLTSTLLFAIGCADRTGVLVEVSSIDLTVPTDVDALRFEVESSTGRTVNETHALTGTWPYSLTIVPRDDADARGTLTLRITGLSEGIPAVRRVVHGVTFDDGETRRVTVELSRDCLGDPCGPDVDCVAGICTGGTVDAGLDGGRGDASVDGGRDAGIDAGRDASLVDAGQPDAGPDTGVDAGPGAAIVISEVAPGGPSGAADEFVEIYNASDSPASIAGLVLEYRAAMGASWSARATVPPGVSLPARSYYVMASTAYARSPTADLPGAWTTGFAGDGGHVRIQRSGTELDRFGWGDAAMPEGTALVALPAGAMSSGSYERKALESSTAATMQGSGAHAASGNGWDSNDNAADFIHRTSAEPQSTASPPEYP